MPGSGFGVDDGGSWAAAMRALQDFQDSAPDVIKSAERSIAELVLRTAQPRVPRRTGRAAGSLMVSGSGDNITVQGGGPRVPWYVWLDFGGAAGRRHHTIREYRPQGRYLYDAYFDRQDSGDVAQLMVAALRQAGNAAGLEVD